MKTESIGFCPLIRGRCEWDAGGVQVKHCIFAGYKQSCLALELVEMLHRLAEPLDTEAEDRNNDRPIRYTIPVSIVEDSTEARAGSCSSCGSSVDRRDGSWVGDEGGYHLLCDGCRAKRYGEA